MHSLRRAIFRPASSAAVLALKPQATTVAARFAVVNSAKVVTIPATRFFGSSSIQRNTQTQTSVEDSSDAEARSAAPNQSFRDVGPPGSEQDQAASSGDQATIDGFMPEPNGVFGVFIWNIPYRSTEREMFDTFSRFGKIHSLNIGRDARGLSRGFAFVYYETIGDAKAAISQADGAFWQGRRIGAKPKNPTDIRAGNPTATARPKSSPSSSLYVGNIPYEATDTELNQLFSGLDNVLDVRVAIDKATGWPRGFAHADFSDVDSATRAMEKLSLVSVQGRQLRIDYSESKRSTNAFVGASEQPGPDDKVL